MANSLFNMARSTTPAGVARRALQFMGEPVEISTLSWLGPSADRSLRLAEHLQDAENDVLNDLPTLNIETVSISLVAATATVSIPSTMRVVDLYGVRWNTAVAGEVDYDEYPIQLITSAQMDAKMPGWRAGTETDDWPSYAVIDLEDQTSGGRLYFYPTPTTARTATAVIRKVGTTYDAASMTSSSVYVLVPNAAIPVLAYKLAATLAVIKYPDPARALFLEAQYKNKLAFWSDALGNIPALLMNPTFGKLGSQEPANALAGQMAP